MDDVEEGTVCVCVASSVHRLYIDHDLQVIMAEGKEHALAVGVTKMSTDVM